MFRAALYYLFRFKLYRSTLVTAATLASFTCNAINYHISDIDFGYADFKSFDFEGMEDPSFNLDEVNEIDDVLTHLPEDNSVNLSKSCFSRLKKLFVKKILLKYVKGFTSLSPNERTYVMGNKLRSFRKFVSKISRKKISKDDLYKSFKNKVKDLNLPLDTSKCKHLFYYKNEHHPIAKGNPVSKAAYPCFENEEEEAIGTLYLGCVLIACGTLIGIIPVAYPPSAPLCATISTVVTGMGIGCVHDGLNKGRDLKKKPN